MYKVEILTPSLPPPVKGGGTHPCTPLKRGFSIFHWRERVPALSPESFRDEETPRRNDEGFIVIFKPSK